PALPYTLSLHDALPIYGLRIPYRMRDPKLVVDEFATDNQPYAVFIDNNLGSRRDYLRALCHALRQLNKIWSAAVSIDVTDDRERSEEHTSELQSPCNLV